MTSSKAVPQPSGLLQEAPSLAPVRHGHYRGTAAYADEPHQYHAEALITADGEVRLYIGGPGDVSALNSGAGLPAFVDPVVSAQFVGSVLTSGELGSGSGILLGQACKDTDLRRFCDNPGEAELSITWQRAAATDSTHESVIGEVRVATNAGEEVWHLDLSPWSVYYRSPAGSSDTGYAGPRGLYTELLAGFAKDGDVTMVVDAGGRLFFQSPGSGCVGNGSLATNGNGEFYVFDVHLLIENCNSEYSWLDGELEGLATESQNGAWDYDSWLIMFLSTPAGSGSTAAVTMMAARNP